MNNKSFWEQHRKFILIVVISFIIFITIFIISSCQAIKSGLKGDNPKVEESADKIVTLSKEVVREDKSIDTEKLQELLKEIGTLSQETKKNKMNWFELFGYMFGTSVATYLGTRKLRLFVGSKFAPKITTV